MFSNTFPDRAVISETVAKMLLEINAVHFRADQPFTFTSGLASPVYIDCRKLISYPRIRSAIMDFAASIIFRNVGFEQFDAVAGGETAGIPFAAWLSDRLGLPMQYVRKKPKGFGRDAQIEGALAEGARVLLVEDLTTDGGSKLKFAEAIARTGARVTDTFAVFYYDIFPDTPQKLEAAGMRLHYLATWWDILKVCKEQQRFSRETITEVESFLNGPVSWSANHGGISELPRPVSEGQDHV
jgi:orotate phosphoribosyltransferase